MIYWVLHIILLAGLSFLSFRFLKSCYPPFVFWAGLILKLLAGIMLGLIFLRYYESGDTIAFFEAATNSEDSNLENQPRSQFFVRMISPLVTVTGGSYWLTSLWLSFISFIAIWFSTNLIARLFPNHKVVVVVSFLFIPSIIFWSSGIMKDTMAFAALVVMVALVLKFYRLFRISILEISIGIFAAFILLQIKHYLFITFLIFGGALIASTLIKRFGGKSRLIFAAMVFVLATVTTQFIHPYLEIGRIPWTLYENNRAILEKSDPEGQLDIVIEHASWTAVISQIPNALHAGLFRPSMFDKTPIWGWIHRIENLLLSVAMILSLLLYFKLKPEVDWVLFVSSLAGILLLAVMLPLSTPNFGTLVRYKTAYMPYLFLISSILPYKYFTSKTID